MMVPASPGSSVLARVRVLQPESACRGPRPARVPDATGFWGDGAALMERDRSMIRCSDPSR